MYCSNCGTKARGRFCSECGQKIAPDDDTPVAAPVVVPSAHAATLVEDVPEPDWIEEVDYATLLRFPIVRDRIERAAGEAKKGITGEDLIGWYEKAFSSIHGVPIPLTKVLTITTPMLDRMGFHTDNSRTQNLARPVAQVLVAALCSFARNSQTLKKAHQATDGCVFEVAIPSSLWTLESAMVVSVRRIDNQTEVSAKIHIPAQVYDWGKSKNWLDTLFEDLQTRAI